MKFNALILFTIISLACTAKDHSKLKDYLLHHSYTIDLNSDSAFNMLPTLMKGKNVLVLGEGGSHKLPLYTTLKPALINQLAKQNLKYYIIEWSRATAMLINNYLQSKNKNCPDELEPLCGLCNKLKPIIERGHEFKVVGIDFEFCGDLHTEMQLLFGKTNLDVLPHSKELLRDLLSNRYKNVFRKKFKEFYLVEQAKFCQDSVAIRKELGEKYDELRYLLTNPNTTYPGIDRNGGLAENLQSELTPLDTSAAYLVDVGLAHSIPSESYSMMHKIYRNDTLRQRTIIMNLHCWNCTLNGENLDATVLNFLKGDVLDCFTSATNTTLTLFDLSELPDEYSYIKESGDLLLFAKDLH